MTRPIIAVTMGDPAGIGPEIVARALAEPDDQKACRPVVVGNPRIMFRAMELVGGGLMVRTIASLQGAGLEPGTLHVIPAGELPLLLRLEELVNADPVMLFRPETV